MSKLWPNDSSLFDDIIIKSISALKSDLLKSSAVHDFNLGPGFYDLIDTVDSISSFWNLELCLLLDEDQNYLRTIPEETKHSIFLTFLENIKNPESNEILYEQYNRFQDKDKYVGDNVVYEGFQPILLDSLIRKRSFITNEDSNIKEQIDINLSESIVMYLCKELIENGVEGNSNTVTPIKLQNVLEDDHLHHVIYNVYYAIEQIKNMEENLYDYLCKYLSTIVFILNGDTYSGRYGVSSPTFFGCAAIDPRGKQWELMETLIHEASHQAFYLVERSTPLVREKVLVPSPFRSGLRTLRRVISGAIAFSNSIIALEAYSRKRSLKSAEISEINRRIDELKEKLMEALFIIDGHESLTTAGVETFDYLADVNDFQNKSKLARPHFLHDLNHVFENPFLKLFSPASYLRKLKTKVALFPPQLKHFPRFNIILQSCIENALLVSAEWLYHPIMHNYLFEKDCTVTDELSVIIYCGLNSDLEIENIEIKESLVLIGKEVFSTIQKGDYDFRDLLEEYSWLSGDEFIIDFFANFNSSRNDFSYKLYELENEDIEVIYRDAFMIKQSLELLQDKLPTIYLWLKSVLRVVIVNRRLTFTIIRSGSTKEYIGSVFIDITDNYLMNIELLVHECAHLVFFDYEDRNPLIIANTNKYWSPLRKDPRPLRGIFLAYHALAYINCFYYEANQANIPVQEYTVIKGLEQMLLAEKTLDAEMKYLTIEGEMLFGETKKYSSYAKRYIASR